MFNNFLFLVQCFVGQVAQAARHWAMGWTARVRSWVLEGCTFFFTPSCSDWSWVHSAFCKMSTGAFQGVKTAERRTSHPTSSKYHHCEYVDPRIHIPLGHWWPVIGVPFSFTPVFELIFSVYFHKIIFSIFLCIWLVHNSLAIFYEIIEHIGKKLMINNTCSFTKSVNRGVIFQFCACRNRIVLSSRSRQAMFEAYFHPERKFLEGCSKREEKVTMWERTIRWISWVRNDFST